ncbi:MAG: hypothetical protein ACYC5H_04510 [Methylovirgula sp.]
MSAALTKSNLLADITAHAAALGLSVHDEGDDGLTGQAESIRAKWFLGGRKVSYHMSCRLAEAEHIVRFREMVSEATWGIPPLTFTVEKTTVKGWQRSGMREDRSVGGGGTIDFAQVREELKALVTADGWQFQLEGGRMP